MTTTQSEITEERLREMLAGLERPADGWDGVWPDSFSCDPDTMRQVLTLALEALTRRSSAGVVNAQAIEAGARAIAYDEWPLATDAERAAWAEKHWPRYESTARSCLSALSPQEPVTGEAVAWRVRERPGFHWVLVDGDPDRDLGLSGFEKQPLYLHPAPSPLPAAEGVASALEVAGWTDKLLTELATKDPWTYADQTTARGLLVSFKGILAAALASPSTGVDDAMVERALDAPVVGTCPVSEYLDFRAADAKELGVLLPDGENFSKVDIVRHEQWRATARAIIRAALLAAHGEK